MRTTLLIALWLLQSVLVAGAARASVDPIKTLQDGGHLSIATALEPDGILVPGQRARLIIEIATDTWFSGGVRIRIPEVAGLVILQTEQFASNASERRNGVTWVLQRWSLHVYPQRAGSFVIPPVALEVSVADAAGDSVAGSLETRTTGIQARVPASLEAVDFWVAAPRFAVSQSFDRPLNALAVGDAFERRIEFAATDLQAMMLPDFQPAEIAGLSAYPAPAKLDNSSNRGASRATRSERISYVAEQPGEYLLPARDYYWWNTRNSALELLSLEETRILVRGDVQATPATGSPTTLRQLLGGAALLLLAAGVFWGCWRYARRLPWQGLQRATLALRQAWETLQNPALPERLNPGSSDGD